MATHLYVRTASGGTGPDVLLADLGIIIPTDTQWLQLNSSGPARADDTSGYFTARELRDSVELYLAIVNDQSLEWSKDGFTVEPAASYTADYMLFEDFTDDRPSFLDLGVQGTLTVSGTNVNAHFNGGANKHDASEIDVEGTYSNIPAAPSDLESVIASINTQLGGVAAYSFANITTDQGTAVADAAADTLTIVGADGILTGATPGTDTVTISGTNLLPRDGSRAMTGNLDLGTNDITNVGNVDGRDVSADGTALDNHLDGTASKHDASEIDVEGTYTNIPGTPTDLETALSAIDTALGAATANAFGTFVPDLGASVVADASSDTLTLTGANGITVSGVAATDTLILDTNALLPRDGSRPMTGDLNLGFNDITNVQDLSVSGVATFTQADLLLPVDTVAPTPLANGQTVVVSGIPYVYDGSRSKWLSINRETFWTSRNSGTAAGLYLRGSDGTATSATGFRMVRNGTITGLMIAVVGASTCTIEVRKNDSVTVIASIVCSGNGTQNAAVNVDFNAGDELQVYLNGAAQYPTAGVEVAWRI